MEPSHIETAPNLPSSQPSEVSSHPSEIHELAIDYPSYVPSNYQITFHVAFDLVLPLSDTQMDPNIIQNDIMSQLQKNECSDIFESVEFYSITVSSQSTSIDGSYQILRLVSNGNVIATPTMSQKKRHDAVLQCLQNAYKRYEEVKDSLTHSDDTGTDAVGDHGNEDDNSILPDSMSKGDNAKQKEYSSAVSVVFISLCAFCGSLIILVVYLGISLHRKGNSKECNVAYDSDIYQHDIFKDVESAQSPIPRCIEKTPRGHAIRELLSSTFHVSDSPFNVNPESSALSPISYESYFFESVKERTERKVAKN